MGATLDIIAELEAGEQADAALTKGEAVAILNALIGAIGPAVVQAEFGLGAEEFRLYLRHADGTVTTRHLKGARGRQGRRGRMGQMPRHEWDETGRRVRFEQSPGIWGPWSADLGAQATEGVQ